MKKKDSKATRPPHATSKTDGSEETSTERFVNDLLVRGEAARPDSDGTLPLDATHAITKESKDGGTPQVKRVRFKAF
jgi:hypothetical protein